MLTRFLLRHAVFLLYDNMLWHVTTYKSYPLIPVHYLLYISKNTALNIRSADYLFLLFIIVLLVIFVLFVIIIFIVFLTILVFIITLGFLPISSSENILLVSINYVHDLESSIDFIVKSSLINSLRFKPE